MKVNLGSYPTTLESSQPLWQDTARAVFNKTLDKNFVERNGLYDKIIMGCSFREKLMPKASKTMELLGGCKHFDQTLTSKGLCYSFNGVKPSSLWRPSKIVTVLEENFDVNHYHHNFSGTGANQGSMSMGQYLEVFHFMNVV